MPEGLSAFDQERTLLVTIPTEQDFLPALLLTQGYQSGLALAFLSPKGRRSALAWGLVCLLVEGQVRRKDEYQGANG